MVEEEEEEISQEGEDLEEVQIEEEEEETQKGEDLKPEEEEEIQSREDLEEEEIKESKGKEDLVAAREEDSLTIIILDKDSIIIMNMKIRE